MIDASALAIYVASTARTTGDTLRPTDVAQRLQLRTDFGRIAQAFPIDKAVLQERLPQRHRLREAIGHGGVRLALASPGSGKSWALTQVAEDLRKEGLVVALHYCFLEPGDELAEQRITTNVFFDNLLGELDDAFKSCGLTPPQRFAAGLDALDDYLRAHLQRRFRRRAQARCRLVKVPSSVGIGHVHSNPAIEIPMFVGILLTTRSEPYNIPALVGTQ